MAKEDIYDVVIVGSGAAGGIAAKVLTQGGARVLMLEAGPMRDKEKDYPYHKWPWEFPFRGGASPKDSPRRPFRARSAYDSPYLFNYHPDEPYTWEGNKYFEWVRARAVGGRTLYWGRVSWRFNEWDFKGYSRDGYGVDWPISYQDVEPYYTKVEEEIGICGNADHIDDAPDGKFLPAPPFRCGDHIIIRACKKLGLPYVAKRSANLTVAYRGKAKCHFCGRCGNGCETDSKFTSVDYLLPQAKATGRFTLRTLAMARHILVDPKTGKARGVAYVDKTTGQDREVFAKIVVAACGTLESARLMLNSRSSTFPNGIANGSGQLGRNFQEHVDIDCSFLLPELRKRAVINEDSHGGSNLIIPWWGWRDKSLKFPRGFHIEVGNGFNMAVAAYADRLPGFGRALKQEIKEWYGTRGTFHAHGEMIANEKTYVDLDPLVVDKWRIPALRIHAEYGAPEMEMFRYAIEKYHEILDTAGARILTISGKPETPGASIHEVGTARMGTDPKKSVLNPFCQAHECKNLLVMDGSCFPTVTHKNPTITIMALAWRSSEFILDQVLKGNL